MTTIPGCTNKKEQTNIGTQLKHGNPTALTVLIISISITACNTPRADIGQWLLTGLDPCRLQFPLSPPGCATAAGASATDYGLFPHTCSHKQIQLLFN